MGSFKRIVTILLGGVAMAAVALVCAYLALRVAIHGREVVVPNLAGRSDADAADAAKSLGLNLSVENRFFSSAIAPNHVLSQSPVAGARVRRGWQIRVTESLGQQRVSVPDVTGQAERPASLVLRRLQLEQGAVAHLSAPAPAGVVLAQSPPPNFNDMNGPRVALLVSEEETHVVSPGFVMPSLVGLTLYAASVRLASAGLHIASTQEPEAATESGVAGTDGSAAAAPTTGVATQPSSGPAVIAAQSPLPGRRVTRADAIHVTLSR